MVNNYEYEKMYLENLKRDINNMKSYSEFVNNNLTNNKTEVVSRKTNKYGELHSLTEPAILLADGTPKYYICGLKYKYNDWKRYVEFLKNKNLKIHKSIFVEDVIVYTNFYNRFSEIIDLSIIEILTLILLISVGSFWLFVFLEISIIFINIFFMKDKRITFHNENEALKYINSQEDIVSIEKIIDKYETEINYLQKRLQELNIKNT
jgi:hypothetical protein